MDGLGYEDIRMNRDENRKWVADYDSIGECSNCGNSLGQAVQDRENGEKWCSVCVEAERMQAWERGR